MTREPGTSERENGFREPGVERYAECERHDMVIMFVEQKESEQSFVRQKHCRLCLGMQVIFPPCFKGTSS